MQSAFPQHNRAATQQLINQSHFQFQPLADILAESNHFSQLQKCYDFIFFVLYSSTTTQMSHLRLPIHHPPQSKDVLFIYQLIFMAISNDKLT